MGVGVAVSFLAGVRIGMYPKKIYRTVTRTF